MRIGASSWARLFISISTIRTRWLKTVEEVYAREAKLVEKYALRPTPDAASTGGGGGEYPLQDAFGWTNGVVRQWLVEPGAGVAG
ncbi:trehalase family glycosidase [Pseudorhodoferax soli]|uniref:trehalase family glycosidase n=1 Tax=Pseudorhodoferax soli TaxID=545864 RepID=UPI003CCC4C0C